MGSGTAKQMVGVWLIAALALLACTSTNDDDGPRDSGKVDDGTVDRKPASGETDDEMPGERLDTDARANSNATVPGRSEAGVSDGRQIVAPSTSRDASVIDASTRDAERRDTEGRQTADAGGRHIPQEAGAGADSDVVRAWSCVYGHWCLHSAVEWSEDLCATEREVNANEASWRRDCGRPDNCGQDPVCTVECTPVDLACVDGGVQRIDAGEPDTSGVDLSTNTNWFMRCATGPDCGNLDCVCGVCTRACDEDSTCADLSEDAACVPQGEFDDCGDLAAVGICAIPRD